MNNVVNKPKKAVNKPKKRRWGWFIIAGLISYPYANTAERIYKERTGYDSLIVLIFVILACFSYYWLKKKIKFIKNENGKSMLIGFIVIIIFSFLIAVSIGSIGLIRRITLENKYTELEQNINIASQKQGFSSEEYIKKIGDEIEKYGAEFTSQLATYYKKRQELNTRLLVLGDPTDISDVKNDIVILKELLEVEEKVAILGDSYFDFIAQKFSEFIGDTPKNKIDLSYLQEEWGFNPMMLFNLKDISTLSKARIDIYKAKIAYYQAILDGEPESKTNLLIADLNAKNSIYEELNNKAANFLKQNMSEQVLEEYMQESQKNLNN